MRISSAVAGISSGVFLGLIVITIWHVFDVSSSSSAPALVFVSETADISNFLQPPSEVSYWPIRDFNILEPDISARAAGVYDTGAGRFLFTKNEDEQIPIASITKLMTAIVVIENLNLNEIYTVNAEDVNVSGLGADLYEGERVRGDELLKMMLIKSSNDAAMVFASAASEKGINVVQKMNEKAKLFNMGESVFYDPAGLDARTHSSVADIVKLVLKVGNYDIIWQTLRIKSADISSADGKLIHHIVSTNKLLDRLPGIIGGKTGYTEEALGTMALVISIEGGKDSLISVVLGSNNRMGETQQLINWAEQSHKWR
ncbi:MAG: D-alanyl-D-alanine carboxypeptidase [Parcubacteria group bacterium Licking1014_17]|nr:MAG: D-alanyl-D-alanine carboxypeptidase [Parcubacteria group bacterium Licking1014_17]